ncbi:hypothetical protein AOLI_G00091100 [Acnodon oligacanthus]
MSQRQRTVITQPLLVQPSQATCRPTSNRLPSQHRIRKQTHHQVHTAEGCSRKDKPVGGLFQQHGDTVVLVVAGDGGGTVVRSKEPGKAGSQRTCWMKPTLQLMSSDRPCREPRLVNHSKPGTLPSSTEAESNSTRALPHHQTAELQPEQQEYVSTDTNFKP